MSRTLGLLGGGGGRHMAPIFALSAEAARLRGVGHPAHEAGAEEVSWGRRATPCLPRIVVCRSGVSVLHQLVRMLHGAEHSQAPQFSDDAREANLLDSVWKTWLWLRRWGTRGQQGSHAILKARSTQLMCVCFLMGAPRLAGAEHIVSSIAHHCPGGDAFRPA